MKFPNPFRRKEKQNTTGMTYNDAKEMLYSIYCLERQRLQEHFDTDLDFAVFGDREYVGQHSSQSVGIAQPRYKENGERSVTVHIRNNGLSSRRWGDWRPIPDRELARTLSTMFHELRHAEQFARAWSHTDDPEVTRALGILGVGANYYWNNHHQNLSELDAMKSGWIRSYQFLASRFPESPVKGEVIREVNESVRCEKPYIETCCRDIGDVYEAFQRADYTFRHTVKDYSNPDVPVLAQSSKKYIRPKTSEDTVIKLMEPWNPDSKWKEFYRKFTEPHTEAQHEAMMFCLAKYLGTVPSCMDPGWKGYTSSEVFGVPFPESSDDAWERIRSQPDRNMHRETRAAMLTGSDLSFAEGCSKSRCL